MIRSISFVAFIGALMMWAEPVRAQVSLQIDGESIAGPDEILNISYSSQALRIQTIYKDIRCVSSTGESVNTSGGTTLVLDQVSEGEAEAEYVIASAGEGGAIEYDTTDGVLRITTTDETGQKLVCARFRSALWGEGFEDPFSSSAATPASPFPVGNMLTIPFTVTNETLTTVVSDVFVDFRWSAVDDGDAPVTEVTAPTYSAPGGTTPQVDALAANEDRWTIDVLWPGESRTINVNFALDPTVPADTLITTKIFNAEASNRSGDASVPTVGVAPLVSEVLTGEASLTIDKTQVGGPEPVTQAGVQLDYEVAIQNTGTFTLTGVEVTDLFPNGTDETLLNPVETQTPDAVFEPGETWTYSASYTVEQSDIDSGGPVVNQASVSTIEVPGPIAATAETVVDAAASQSIELTTAAGQADAAGQTVPYTVVVTNDGEVSLTGVAVSVELPDGSAGSLAGPVESATEDNRIEPDETWTYTTEYTVSQDDLDTKTTLTAVAVVTTNEAGTSNNPATVAVVKTAGLGLTKRITANETYAAVGDVIQYAFDIENTGNQTLAGPVTVDDDLTGDESCPDLTTVGDGDSNLQPGEVAVCTASLTVTQVHLDQGSIENTATASADGETTDPASATATADQQPSLALAKSVASITDFNTGGTIATYATVGDVITYDFEVTNDGNVTLDGPITISDDQAQVDPCPLLTAIGNGNGTFEPDETLTCTGTRTVAQADLDAGSIVNIASASAAFDASPVTSPDAQATATADQDPLLSVTVDDTLNDGGDGAGPGDTIDYSFTLENVGNVTLDNITVTVESSDASVTIDGSPLASLDVDADDSTTITATRVLDSDDIANSPFEVRFRISADQLGSDVVSPTLSTSL